MFKICKSVFEITCEKLYFHVYRFKKKYINWDMGSNMKSIRPDLNQRGLWLIAMLKRIDIIQLVTLSYRSSSTHCVQCVNSVEKSHITQIRTIVGSSVFYLCLVCLFVCLSVCWFKTAVKVIWRPLMNPGKLYCMPSLLAPDPIRVQSCVWCIFWTNRNCMAVTSIFLSISSSN